MTETERDLAPCLLHPASAHRAAEGYLTCTAGGARLRDALDDIVRLAAGLTDPDALLPRRGSDVARGAPGYKSSPPANLTVIALTDWRSIAWYRGDPDDVLGVLAHWADKVRGMTGMAPRSAPPTVPSEVGVLVRMFDWLRRQDVVARCAWEVLNVRDLLLELAGELRGRVPLGRCTTPVADPDGGQERTCGYLLQVRPGDRAVRCPCCLTSWPALHWPTLAAALQAGAR